MNSLFSDPGFSVRPVTENDFQSTLDVYRRSEDFLALGPVPRASAVMVAADIARSQENKGIFCGIWNEAGEQVGVIDFFPTDSKGTAFLELLMIASPYRGRGLGTAVLSALEAHLKIICGVRRICSGVQVNNEAGIRFWRKRGFTIGRRARKLPDGTTAYGMTKKI